MEAPPKQIASRGGHEMINSDVDSDTDSDSDSMDSNDFAGLDFGFDSYF